MKLKKKEDFSDIQNKGKKINKVLLGGLKV